MQELDDVALVYGSWSPTGHQPDITEEHTMYTDDIIDVPTDTTPDPIPAAPAENTTTIDPMPPTARPPHVDAGPGRVDAGRVDAGRVDADRADADRVGPDLAPDPVDPDRADDGEARRSQRGAVVAAILATLVLIVTMGAVLLRGSDQTAAGAPTAPVDASVDASVVPHIVTGGPAADAPPNVPPTPPNVPAPPPNTVSPSVTVPPSITVPPVDTAPPVVPPPIAPPVAPPVDTIPPVAPPVPAGQLAAQNEYVLDPGVDAVSIVLSNQGDRELTYDITNDGDGFTADAPTATIGAGSSVDVWIDLDVAADGDGPTPFERAVQVDSDGGDVVVTIAGQVEKPGFVIADFDSVPFVDFRATLRFTNVGGLPVQIVGLDAPGLTTAPVPDEIAAGQTYELEVAICEGGAPIPTIIPHPQPNPLPPTFTIASWVELETQAGPDADPTVARTDLQALIAFFDPPDCTPVVVSPVGDLTFDLG